MCPVERWAALMEVEILAGVGKGQVTAVAAMEDSTDSTEEDTVRATAGVSAVASLG